jgi:SAM-dependent methyltransferase
MASQLNTFASSTGQTMTGAEWLDGHFEAARPEYEAQLRAVGVQPGWRVLDAACGSGSFLPWLAELVGPTGALAALDLAPDNVALVERRLSGWRLCCPVEARIGSVLTLPYADDAFDAVWFANTSQYLTDDELETALAEFRRVVRPGGLVAVKESDPTSYRTVPGPPGLMLRWFQAAAQGNTQAAGALRAPELPGRLRRAGLRDVWQRTTPIERAAPLGAVDRRQYRDLFSFLAGPAAELALPDVDREVWARLCDPDALDRFLDDPDCWLIEGNILAVGTAP